MHAHVHFKNNVKEFETMCRIQDSETQVIVKVMDENCLSRLKYVACFGGF